MKKLCKMILVLLIIMIFTYSFAMAGEEYTHRRIYSFYNSGKTTTVNAKIKLFVGQKDVTRYGSDGEITIKPEPTNTITDEFGNKYVEFDVSGYKPGRGIDISIIRTYETGKYEEEIPARTESTVTLANEMFVKPQTAVECDNEEIITKAKELAYGLSSDYKRAKRIFEFVNTTMNYDASDKVSNKGAVSALETKKGQCYDYATLYAALCRAIDIPCKVIIGYKVEKVEDVASVIKQDEITGEYYNTKATYKYEFIPHAWNEIYFDDFGWVPVDTCVVYNVNGKKSAYWDSFCKIDGTNYFATGLLNADENYEYVYTADTGDFSIRETNESYVPSEEYVEKVKHKFEDVSNYPWAEESINTLYDMGVIKGFTDQEYGPAANITRIDFICMLARILKNQYYNPSFYKKIYYYRDYDINSYSKQEYDFLMRCYEDSSPFDPFAAGYGVIAEIFEGSLEPSKAITRGEVVALMDAFIKTKSDGSANFSDMYSSKFSSSIAKAYTSGLIKGYSDGSFRPNNPITRAEIAVILDRYVGVKEYEM